MLSRIIAVALVGTAVAACASNPQTAAGPQQSTLVGGPLPPPATFGAPVGGDQPAVPERVNPAVASAAIGGMFGSVGAAMDDDDKQRAYAAQIQALESGGPGAPVAWRNPDSGHYGSIVPGPTFDRGGNKCRQYTHTVYIDSKPQTARGAACRNSSGRWTPV
jgi:surface antigen